MFTAYSKFKIITKTFHLISSFANLLDRSQRRFASKLSEVRPTIYALSSGQGKCGVAVIRVSGPHSKEVLKQFAGFKSVPEPRKVFLRKLKDPQSKEVLDHGLVIWFAGPKSFTGEDSCELQVHGGPAVVSAVLRALSNLKSFRPAEPGEFTKRAFYAGKIDLTEVEGLGDLIHAETELQRKQALFQMEGALGEVYDGWKNILLECVAYVESYIDFSEDQNLEEDILNQVREKVASLRTAVQKHLEDGRRGERLRSGVHSAIVGAPNVGKSSLMNALCQHQRAIVSPIPGTTRDIVQSTVDIGGFPVVLSDTAGLRSETSDTIEEEGIARAKSTATSADMLILVIDATELEFWCSENSASLKTGFQDYLNWYSSSLGINDLIENRCANKCLIVINKIDCSQRVDDIVNLCNEQEGSVAAISCKTQAGMEHFLQCSARQLQELCGNPTRENPSWNAERHRHWLKECVKALDRFLAMSEAEVDLAAEELRQALYSLGSITGHVSTEQILDVIFKEFCIGK